MGRQQVAFTRCGPPLPAHRFLLLLFLFSLHCVSLCQVSASGSSVREDGQHVASCLGDNEQAARCKQEDVHKQALKNHPQQAPATTANRFHDTSPASAANDQFRLNKQLGKHASRGRHNVTAATTDLPSHARLRRALKDAGTESGNAQVIYGTLRGQVVFQCNLETSEPDDSVSLVLWYKDKSMVPIYSIDARGATSLQEARQKPGAWLEGRSSLNFHHQTGGGGSQRQPGAGSGSYASETPEEARTRNGKQQQRECGSRSCALLTVEALSSEDNGLYWCRVEFRHARSRIQLMQLRITVAADKPVVRELTPPSPGRPPAYLWDEGVEAGSGAPLLVGPYDEGARLVLECETQGGYPEPQLSWWRDGRLIDDSYEVLGAQSGSLIVRYPGSSLSADTVDEATFLERASFNLGADTLAGQPPTTDDNISLGSSESGPQRENQDQEAAPNMELQQQQASLSYSSLSQPRLLRNRLELVALTRADLTANYSCQAWNTKLSKPPTTFVMIDMNLRPIKVQIENERLPVLADRPLEIVCRALGSRPSAELSWFRNGQEVVGATSGGSQQQQQQQQQRETPSAVYAPVSAIGTGNRALAGQQVAAAASNMSLSTLALVPQPEDNGQVIKCRAKNSLLMMQNAEDAAGAAPFPGGAALEDSWQLEVHHLPRVTLTLGDKLQNLSIREGMDVYFECSVQARPGAHELRWWFEGKELDTNVSAGVIISNQSLVLQRVSRQQRGRYTCSALNQVGEGHSNSVPLRVQYAPVCASQAAGSSSSLAAGSSSQQQTPAADEDPFSATSQRPHKTSYGAAQLERVQVSCHVMADPAEGLTYRWALEQHDKVVSLGSGEPLPEQSTTSKTPSTSTVGLLNYTPRNELDYGTLLCWASNALGEQKEACKYQLVPAERPDPVRNCRLINASDVQLTVACEPGYDGGDQQSFQMEIYEVAQGHQAALVANVTGSLIETTNAPPDATQQQPDSDLFTNLLKPFPVGAPMGTVGLATQVASGATEQRLQRQRHSQQNQAADMQNAMAADGPQPPPRPLVLIRSEPRLAPATNYFLSIYSVNGKGSSQPVAFSASTAVDSGGPVAADLMEAGGASFSTKSRSQSDKQIGDQHLLGAGSEEQANNWSSLLVVGSIGLAMFVMFVSVSFALIKYVDFRRAFPAAASGPGARSSAITSRSTTSSTASGDGSPVSQKARMVELSGGGSPDSKTCLPDGEDSPATRLKLKFHQKLRHLSRGSSAPLKNNHLRPSNSDNYLNQLPEACLDQHEEHEAQSSGFLRGPLYRTLPRNCGQLAFPMHTGVYLAEPGRLDQLRGPISEAGGGARLQQRNLQVTGCSAGNFFQPHHHHHQHLQHLHHQTPAQLLCVSNSTSAMINGRAGHMEPLVQESACTHFFDEAGCLVCPPPPPEVDRFAVNGCCEPSSSPPPPPTRQHFDQQQLNLEAPSSFQSHTSSPSSTPIDLNNHQQQQRLLCHRQLQLQQLQTCGPNDLVHGSSSTLTTTSSVQAPADAQPQESQLGGQPTDGLHHQQARTLDQLALGAAGIRIIDPNNALTRHHQMNGDHCYGGPQKHTQLPDDDLNQCTIYVDRAQLIEGAYVGPKVGQIYQLDKHRRKARVRLLNGQESGADQSLTDHVAFYTTTNQPDLQTDV